MQAAQTVLDSGGLPEAAGGAGGQVRAESQAKRLMAPRGDFTTNGERLALAELCTNKELYCGSAGLYAGAFGPDTKLANAVCKFHAAKASSCIGGWPARRLISARAVWLRILRISRWHRCHRSLAHARLTPYRSASCPLLASTR